MSDPRSNQAPEIGIVFETEAEFRREFDANLANGGVFVPTDQAFEIRDTIRLGIDLRYCGEAVVLEGEIVHQIPAELASVGARPGVALQLTLPASELRARLEALPGAFSEDFDESTLTAPALEPGAERRKSTRGRARVEAWLSAPGRDDEAGQTRNLSESGLLFSNLGEPVPIDTPVVLRLANPVTGQTCEVAGSVARHVSNDAGVVAAVGIHFVSESERSPDVTPFLRSLMATEHSRHLGGISGSIAELGLASLIQNFGQSAPQGTLTIASGADEGSIAFEGGRLVGARIGMVTGAKALARLMEWTEGRFEFHARVEQRADADEPVSLQAALLEAARQMDELARLDLRSVPRSATLAVGSGAPDLLSEGLGKLEEAIIDLCVGKTTVRRILDVIPEPDADVYRALQALLDERAITLVRAGSH